MSSAQDVIRSYLQQSAQTLQHLAQDVAATATIAAVAETVSKTFARGNKLLLAGNGGSAADAQHIAAEFVGRFGSAERQPLPAIALTTDTSLLTATGNDYGFEQVFARQLRGLGKPGDAFIAISTSGTSPNIIAALKAARELQIVTIGFSGPSGGDMRGLCDLTFAAPGEKSDLCPASAAIQQIHITAAHIICGLVEQTVLKR